MPANRNNFSNNASSNNSANASNFFSRVIQPTGNQRIPLGTSGRSTVSASSGSWIVTELQQAQQQIERTLQSVNTGTSALDPSATPFYLHPRQSTEADFLDGQQQQQQHQVQQSPISPALLSPQTIQAARRASATAADELIESYLEAALADNNSNEDASETEMESEMEAFIQPSATTLINQNSLPIQLQQVLRTASVLHNSSSTLRAVPNTTRGVNPGNSALRNKIVYRLQCLYCTTPVCERAMRAILLADTKVELYSTDIPPRALKTMDEDRLTQGCNCRIRDTVCTGCGNVLGYHVSQPCDRCLDARNNGHFWMFYSEGVSPAERKDLDGSGPLFWASLTPMCEFVPASACASRPGLAGNNGQDQLCR